MKIETDPPITGTETEKLKSVAAAAKLPLSLGAHYSKISYFVTPQKNS